MASKKKPTRARLNNTSIRYLPRPSEDVPLTIEEACAFFGGSQPIDPSTYYRNVKAGRYPKPFHISPNVVRVMRSDCEKARQALADQTKQ